MRIKCKQQAGQIAWCYSLVRFSALHWNNIPIAIGVHRTVWQFCLMQENNTPFEFQARQKSSFAASQRNAYLSSVHRNPWAGFRFEHFFLRCFQQRYKQPTLSCSSSFAWKGTQDLLILVFYSRAVKLSELGCSSDIVKMDVLALLICCFVSTGAAQQRVRKPSFVSKAYLAARNAANAARTLVSRQRAETKDRNLARCSVNSENECNQSRVSKLCAAMRADWQEKSFCSSSDSLMTISSAGTPRKKGSDELAIIDAASHQECKSEIEKLEKTILCWKKGGTFPVRLRASILEECFGMVLLGR